METICLTLTEGLLFALVIFRFFLILASCFNLYVPYYICLYVSYLYMFMCFFYIGMSLFLLY